ncbi:hypothetical protein Taro_053152, partial [Colocasia esculenta]|nr:hypothetical protein [Colocasia esculenta]
ALVGLCVPCARVVCFVSRTLCTLPEGVLVSVVGVWLAVPLRGQLCAFFLYFPWVARGGGAGRAVGAMFSHCGDLCGEGIVPVHVSLVPQLCLEALVAIWCVALSACGGRSGASCCALLRANMVVELLKLLVLHPWCVVLHFWRLLVLALAPCVVLCVLIVSFVHHFGSLPGVRGVELSTSGTLYAGRALWLYRYRCGVATLPRLGSPIGVVSIPMQFADVLCCLALPTSDVFLGFVSARVPVEHVV